MDADQDEYCLMTLDLAVPKFEFAARMQAARATLAATGADCAVLMAPEAQYWLCGYDTFPGALLPQALILTPGGDEPSLVVWDADMAIAWDTSLVRDIRT